METKRLHAKKFLAIPRWELSWKARQFLTIQTTTAV